MLYKKVSVAPRFQRSIRIDTDLSQPSAMDGYICPPSASNAVISMASQIANGVQRAFTFTGPYGGGKSSLAIVLGNLLGPAGATQRKAAEVIGSEIATQLLELLPRGRKGWMIIPVIGQQDSPVNTIAKALLSHRVIQDDALAKRLAKTPSASDVLDALEIASSQFRKTGGVLLIIDEMGKFLEHTALNSGDLFFFQELAERSSRLEAKLVTLGFLHQAFSQYASNLGNAAQDEWAKVQGRFLDVPFQAGHDETIDLIGKAIEADPAPKAFSILCNDVATEIILRRPGTTRDLGRRLTNAWPLHPVVTALLGPVSTKRFGQNQRSTFGFLTSGEPFAFQEFLQSNEVTRFVSFGPDKLWDYLQANLEPLIISSPDGHRWASAAEIIDRVESRGTDLHVALAKTIAIIDVFRGRSGLLASLPILTSCHPDKPKKQVKKVLDELLEWSAVVYRKHLEAFTLFAGSDFDIEEATKDALRAGISVNFDQLSRMASLRPIVAKKHYIRTGAMRWFGIELSEFYSLKKRLHEFSPSAGEMGMFMLALPSQDINDQAIHKEVSDITRSAKNASVAVAVLPGAEAIRVLSKELLALETIRSTHDALHGDPVARKEVSTRISHTSQALSQALGHSISEANWFWKGKPRGVKRLEDLSQFASEIADDYFKNTPTIRSELINREKPSSNAVAARNALLERMLTHEKSEALAYDGYPAEAGLFYTVLQATGIHNLSQNGSWSFSDHGVFDANLKKLWDKTDELLGDGQLIDLVDVYSLWVAAPFGLSKGLLPVLALAYMLSRRSTLAIYLHGKFRPRWEPIIVHDMIADPRLLTLRKANLSGFREKVIVNLHKALERLLSGKLEKEPFVIAKAMVTFFMRLPPWVHATDTISQDAAKVRSILKTASDPHKLLFEDLSSAFTDVEAADEDGGAKMIAIKVEAALSEMGQAYPAMIQKIKWHLLNEVGLEGDGITELADLQQRAIAVEDATGELRLKSFAGRLKNFSGDTVQIESIAGLAGSASPKQWRDGDVKKAYLELTAMSTEFRRIEALAHVRSGSSTGHQAIAVVVGTGKEAETYMESANLTKKQLAMVQRQAEKLTSVLTKMSADRAIQIATLAEVGLSIMSRKLEE